MPSVSTGIYKWLFRRSASLEDFADRLNHFWTVGLLLLLACIISWRQTYISPITCWTPPAFTSGMAQYTHNQCWNSYFIEDVWEDRLDDDNILDIGYFPTVYMKRDGRLVDNENSTRTLYQWLPLILCLQALLFKLPYILMYIFHSMSGISFDKIAGLTNGYENLTLQERSKLCRQIARYFSNWCQRCSIPWRQLTLLWLLVKVLYVANILTQLKVIDNLLAVTNSTSFGDTINGNLFDDNATEWRGASAFPKEIYCEFPIYQLQNVNRFYVQCSLPGNHFSEFAYMFLWVWMTFVAVVTCTSLFFWLLKTLIPIARKSYITKALSLNEDLNVQSMSPIDIGKFCDQVGEDGVMALKLAASNSSELLVSEVVKNMWVNMTQNVYTVTSGGQGGDILPMSSMAPPDYTQPPPSASAASKMYPDMS